MLVANNTIVSLRYVMKNDAGEIMEDNTNTAPYNYLHGSGNLMPALEDAMTGLSKGEAKTFSIADKLLNGIFHFDVIIDDVRPASAKEIASGFPAKKITTDDCGTDCCC
ncbi:hypothetical protein FRZ67_04815 [Panacibacter ginsenosidivorans]|uniref:peptidylprolyl isomerase n=1 Tax=Panacibacter ginsenosidivorans TaxID=1813871 RepID=A0A5B8V6Y6_9BACT|nr:FKBP-type peptidyl-prolyl cis-trans isomerase [Panacibacter ginsenosidivorans]QEC66653.1 hypothetical protein FRZ67_04815 [Panacibacter ginsenosidivorans]